MGCEDGLGDSPEVCYLEWWLNMEKTLKTLITHCKLGLSICFRLYSQLRDMESAFDGFFEKHRLKFHQYLQLLRYEQRFQQVTGNRELFSAGAAWPLARVHVMLCNVCLDGGASAGSDF